MSCAPTNQQNCPKLNRGRFLQDETDGNVGNRRNSPENKENHICTEGTTMHRFSMLSVTVYADSLKFGTEAAKYA